LIFRLGEPELVGVAEHGRRCTEGEQATDDLRRAIVIEVDNGCSPPTAHRFDEGGQADPRFVALRVAEQNVDLARVEQGVSVVAVQQHGAWAVRVGRSPGVRLRRRIAAPGPCPARAPTVDRSP
jgi:hypothetical protein